MWAAQKYRLEFMLHSYDASVASIKSTLSEFGEAVEVEDGIAESESAKARDYKVTMCTEDPTMVFDVCIELGRIKSAKVDEIK